MLRKIRHIVIAFTAGAALAVVFSQKEKRAHV